MNTEKFDVIDHEFKQGGTLIEASAGTGKTYSIAFIVLRLVVEKDLPIESILVVTFTNAATAELQSRIRERLQEAKDLLKSQDSTSNDKRLNEWAALRFNAGSESVKEDLRKLNQALSDIDQAQVSTIHSFCQRALSEFPLESQLGFNIELTKNIEPIKQQLVEDFWRQEIYRLPRRQAEAVRQHFQNPPALAKVLEQVKSPSAHVLPQTGTSLTDCLQTIDELGSKLEAWKTTAYAAAEQYVAKGMAETWFKKPQRGTLTKILEKFHKDPIEFCNKVQSASLKPYVQQAQEFVASLKAPMFDLEAQQSAISELRFILQHKLLDHYFTEINNRTQAFGVMSFNDLVTQLAGLINADNQQLINCLRNKFKAALIDEFQDTDADQWCIFNALFNGNEHYLYLIGDPKQAIYKFRGADIYAYIAAKKTCQRHLTLTTNWRSTPNMVDAVNTLYKQSDDPFKMGELMAFDEVDAGKDSNTCEQPLVCWQLPTLNQGEKWVAADLHQCIRDNVCAEITKLIVEANVKPKDIAILVSSNDSAATYQAQLSQLGIAAVINTKQSVFQTNEARDLLWLLKAIETPSNPRHVKQALCASVFGFYGNQIHDLVQHQDQQLEQWFEHFYSANSIWQEKGFISAINELMKLGSVINNLCLTSNAERRLTNWQHLLELAQNQINQFQLSLGQTVLWLENQLQENSIEEAELRLETDAEALQIVTMHSSKGLQYNIVFCPELTKGPKPIKTVSFHDDNQLVIDIGSDNYEDHKQLTAEEAFAEVLRLAYVALTRAEEKCYLVMGENNQLKFTGYDKSAVHYLMNKGVPESPVFATTIIEPDPRFYTIENEDKNTTEYQALEFKKYIDSRFTLTSFTGLTRDQHHDSKDLKDAETETDKHNPVVSNLPKGPHFGNLVHDLYELSQFSDLLTEPDEELLANLIEKYGVNKLNEHLAEFNLMIKHSVTTPLDSSGFHLAQIDDRQCLKEMEFYYRMDQLNIAQFNQIMSELAPDIPYNPLSEKQLSGYLNGSIDLFCEYNGQYFVMDYKTNSLPNYQQTTMHAAMLEHNYGLQAVIYSLAAHQYLQQRLGDSYNYGDHFGGAKYLFVRGMTGEDAEGGVYSFKPSVKLVQTLMNELQGGE